MHENAIKMHKKPTNGLQAFGRQKLRKQQRGMLLIEVLVALLLFVVGILGLVGAMAYTQSAQTDARLRSDAARLADDIVQSIRLNVDRSTEAAFTDSLKSFEHQATTDADCTFSGAASAQPVVTAWVASASATAATLLPGATSAMQQIVVDIDAAGHNKVAVTLCWKAPKDLQARKHVYSAYINDNFN